MFPRVGVGFRSVARRSGMGMTLEQEVRHLRAENTQLKAQLAEVLALVHQLRGTIEKQQAHIHKLVKMTFGRSGERVEVPTLFDGLEAEPPPPPAVEAIAAPVDERVSKRKGHGRKPNPADHRLGADEPLRQCQTARAEPSSSPTTRQGVSPR